MMKRLGQTDEETIKTRLMAEIGKTKDVPTLIGLVGAWTKVRQMELKQEDGDWGSGLGLPTPNLNLPPITDDTGRDPSGH
jgi:hypothetical protein